MKQITTEIVNSFLNGRDPMERIITIECSYNDDKVSIIYVNDKGEKRIRVDDFKPFVWAKRSAAIRLYDGNKANLRAAMQKHGIYIKSLKIDDTKSSSDISERLENGYKYMFYATRPMSITQFMAFFSNGGVPIYETKKKNDVQQTSSREYLMVSPVEQYMVYTGRRLFKGYSNYDDTKRLIFDLETEGLNPKVHRIDQVGIRTNKGFKKVLSVTGNNKVEKDLCELKVIDEMVRIYSEEKPDILVGHNSENFDWDFIIVRCEELGTSLEDISLQYFKHPIYKKSKEAVLKLGGEVEYYKPTIMWGHIILDSLHAARRAQAIDSNMKSSNLKYVTEYLKMRKKNRVYVPGDKITSTWNETKPVYGFCEENGDWYRLTETRPLLEGYEAKSGRYIVERYLLDDLWETDKIELKLNESNFLVAKMLPTTFNRACTMGTAGIWKLIMLAWSYENDLVIPSLGVNKKFTGGLSRLLKTGYVDRIVKLDYNSLYPSIILTWNIENKVDFTRVLNSMLNYVLSQRELYKELKAKAGKKADELKEKLKETTDPTERRKLEEEIQYWEIEKNSNDKKQLPLKILGNSYFGSAGAEHLFFWGDNTAAEKTTCIGRMSLRLMIYHFTNIGYTPIVGDTDGFNFQMPEEDKFRYTEEHPYISTGKGRNTKEGKAYTGVDADVAEFEDMYMSQAYNNGQNKMGLGIDEYCDATINFARKNYSDLMPNGKMKFVGNTIKSRKLSGYLEKFMAKGIDLLLHGNGYGFLTAYYDYVEKIYNYQIPIKDIASKGSIKKTIKDYIEDCSKVTKAGSKKSRQAWYELVIKENMKVNVSDTVYYINTGTKKGHSDVKRVTHFFAKVDGVETEVTKEVEKLYKENSKSGTPKTRLEIAVEKWGNYAREEDEIILNCKLVPTEIVDSEEDKMCSDYDGLEYNVEKYVDQFNKRITPLLVCFHPDIRNEILITDPKDRKFFTEEQSKLVSGYPNKEEDQDTFEALMTPERKEIDFWLRINEVPPFVKECNIDWDELVKKHKEIIKEENNEVFKIENERYLNVLDSLTKAEVEAFEDEGKIPTRILSFMTLGSDMRLYFKKLPNMTPSTGGYVFDDLFVDNFSSSLDED